MTKGPQRSQATGPQMILKLRKRSSMSSNSSKVVKRYSNRPQCPQKFINVLNSSVGNQVSKDPQCPEKSLNSSKASGPQKVQKKSSNVPEMFFNVLRASGPLVFKKSSKGPQSPQKVRKMNKRYPRYSDLRFSTDPHNVLKFLKRSSKPSKSSEVHKRYSSDLNSSKAYQRPQNPVVVKGSSNVHQMVLTKSSKVPKNIPQKVHQRSSKGPENSSMLWDPQVRRSSKSPQKVHKVLEVLIGPQKVFKVTSNTSTIYQRPQFLSR